MNSGEDVQIISGNPASLQEWRRDWGCRSWVQVSSSPPRKLHISWRLRHQTGHVIARTHVFYVQACQELKTSYIRDIYVRRETKTHPVSCLQVGAFLWYLLFIWMETCMLSWCYQNYVYLHFFCQNVEPFCTIYYEKCFLHTDMNK